MKPRARQTDAQLHTRTRAARIAWFCARQHGIVGRAQLRRCGLSRQAIDGRLDARTLFEVYRGAYALSPVVTDDGRRTAAVIAAGEGAVLTHTTATDLYAVTRLDRAPHVTVPYRRNVAIDGVEVHRTRTELAVRRVRGLPVATPARALLDLATILEGRALEKAVGEAIFLRLIGEEEVRRIVAAHAGHPGGRTLRAVDPAAAARRRTDSPLEDRLLAVILAAGLPEPECQRWLTGASGQRYRVDFLYRDAGVIVEADGRTAHARRRGFESDRRRDNDLAAAARWLTLRITEATLSTAPATIAAVLGV